MVAAARVLGHYPAGVVVHLGIVFDYDFNRLFPVFQALSCHRHRSHPHGQLRGTAPLSQPHQFPDQPIAHFDAANQDKHIEDQFAHIVPYDGGRVRVLQN